MTFLPTAVLPVKATLSTSMCEEMALPTVCPYPVTMLTDPGGKPASLIREAIRRAVSGVNSEGLRTMEFPVARAGPIFQESMRTG